MGHDIWEGITLRPKNVYYLKGTGMAYPHIDLPDARTTVDGHRYVLKPDMRREGRITPATACTGCAAAGTDDDDPRDLCHALLSVRHNGKDSLCCDYMAIWIEDTEDAMAAYVVQRLQKG